ncbi:hypothetical protein EJB05_57445, partial [Eragrostis curvula]
MVIGLLNLRLMSCLPLATKSLLLASLLDFLSNHTKVALLSVETPLVAGTLMLTFRRYVLLWIGWMACSSQWFMSLLVPILRFLVSHLRTQSSK